MGTPIYREIRALEALAESVAGPEDLARCLQEVIDSVARWTGADRVSLIQFDRDAREVRHFLRGGPGWAEVMTTIGFEELDSGLSGWALRMGEVALSPGGVPDPREGAEVRRRRAETECGAIMVAPVGNGRERMATITVINRPDQPDFTPEDAENLGLFAAYAGWVVRFAREKERADQARNEARAAIRSKVNFLSNLSHELRTPLNGVLGFSHLLEASNLEPDQRGMVETILESGQRLLATVDNLLELAQFETGQFHLEQTPFSPRAVLEAVVAKHHAQAGEKGLAWTVTSDPDIPPVLEGDPVRIGQAWNHILSNAVKFTSRGTVTVHLEAHRSNQGGWELVLNVADTGIGLSNENSGQWFMPFHQEDGSLTRKFGGTGLGLALCDRIARQMGGGLSLMGEPGVGTKVRVWVNLGHGRGSPPRTTGVSILLQDPDPVGSLAVVKMLEKAGHRVDYVTRVDQARDRAESGRYQILLTEAPSPDPDTLGTLKGPGRRPIALIGLHAVGTVPREDDRVPWAGTLIKPITFATLQTTIARCISREEP